MTYLNYERLDAIDDAAFQSQKPFPWINPQGLLTDDGHQRLVDTLPDVAKLAKNFGVKRWYGQQSHDRYAAEYTDDFDAAEPWRDFVAELRDERYRSFVRRVMGIERFDINCHWHYAPNGCSVSPHCDARRKHGSHVFYFSTSEDWDPAWGGQTVVLDDHGQFDHGANPGFEDMECVAESQAVGNYSLLFKRGEHSWHGVREVRCPEDRLRKVFIVVFNRVTPLVRLRRLFCGLPKGF